MRKIMITGGFGFIGSNLVNYWTEKYPDDKILLLDAMTYAARPEFVGHFQGEHIHCDLREASHTRDAVQVYKPDHVIHLAAESHVCRSIDGPRAFIETNALGTFNLIEACRELWATDAPKHHRFHHISTDEVFGELGPKDKPFDEKTPYAPRSPYAASKAASDMIVRSYFETYRMNTAITNCSNNFGPNQHEEKLIPKTILALLRGEPITLYGDGKQVRDWIHVDDHCQAIDSVFHHGNAGWSYCVGGDMELTNIEVVRAVYKAAIQTGHLTVDKEFRINFTNDRPTDDRRYAVNNALIKEWIGWFPKNELFETHLRKTVRWYAENVMGNRR